MKTKRTLDIIVAGEVNPDLILREVPPLELEKELYAKDMDLLLGGSSSITVFNLARMGARAGFVGVVGDDFFGRFCAERLKWAGVDLKHLRWTKTVRTGLTVWMTRGDRRAGVTYAGTLAMLRAADVPSEYLQRARHLHVGAYFFLSSLHKGAPALFRRARSLGLTTSLDCNYDPTEKWDSGIRRVLKETDVFFPNEDEAQRLTGQRNAHAAAEELRKLARIVVVKRGAKGALVSSEERTFAVPAVRVRAVETTGAGDSFNAGFLAKFVRGASLDECAEAGVESGARAVTKVGGTAAFE
ncbi:MAG: sugar kinase [Bryobacteraceae bacterium]|nr:sugar kinase [Bryobacteraceae bacterium]